MSIHSLLNYEYEILNYFNFFNFKLFLKLKIFIKKFKTLTISIIFYNHYIYIFQVLNYFLNY